MYVNQRVAADRFDNPAQWALTETLLIWLRHQNQFDNPAQWVLTETRENSMNKTNSINPELVPYIEAIQKRDKDLADAINLLKIMDRKLKNLRARCVAYEIFLQYDGVKPARVIEKVGQFVTQLGDPTDC